jgi:succinate dehydrogenase / fumarate reductase flavoprotein subunit
MYDTVKGSDYIGDQDAIEYMCKTGPEAILELEHMGLPFSRLDDGRIYQRPFGGQSKNFGGEQAARTAAAADRTGHALLHTLYQQNLKNHTTIFSEWYALDLVKNQDGAVVGCTALCIETGEVVTSKPAQLCWQRAARVVFTSPPPTRTSIPVTVLVWRCVPVCRCRIWKCGSSTRPVSPGQGCWSPKVAVVKAAIC